MNEKITYFRFYHRYHKINEPFMFNRTPYVSYVKTINFHYKYLFNPFATLCYVYLYFVHK